MVFLDASAVSHFLYFFSSMNLKHSGLCLALQEFLKGVFSINRYLELNSQNYRSHDFGVLADCCKYSVSGPRFKGEWVAYHIYR